MKQAMTGIREWELRRSSVERKVKSDEVKDRVISESSARPGKAVGNPRSCAIRKGSDGEHVVPSWHVRTFDRLSVKRRRRIHAACERAIFCENKTGAF
jgi:hypothetical protein